MPPHDFSRDTLKRLVGRAAELDERATERVSLAQAREIALELGISAAAWDAAVAERLKRPAHAVAAPSVSTRLAPLLTAGAGFVAGALGGWLNRALSGDADVAFGLLLVLGGVALATRSDTKGARRVQVSLAAWWLSIPLGMMVAMQELLTDALWFAAFAWLGSAAFVWTGRRVLRERRSSPGPTLATMS